MAKSYLLDTHCLIWFQENNPQISSRVMEVIQDPDNYAENSILVSADKNFKLYTDIIDILW